MIVREINTAVEKGGEKVRCGRMSVSHERREKETTQMGKDCSNEKARAEREGMEGGEMMGGKGSFDSEEDDSHTNVIGM